MVLGLSLVFVANQVFQAVKVEAQIHQAPNLASLAEPEIHGSELFHRRFFDDRRGEKVLAALEDDISNLTVI